MQYLNEFHRQQHLRSMQMEKERSAKPPLSLEAWLLQVNRLKTRGQAANDKFAKKGH